MLMPWTRRTAVGLTVVLLIAAAWIGGRSLDGVGEAAAAGDVTEVAFSAPFTMPLPPDIQQRFAEIRAAGAGQARPAAAPAQEPVLVDMQNFDDPTFPPGTWQVIDRKVPTGTAARRAWGRETCEVDPQRGGQGAAWSVGGGTAGGAATCWSPYPAGAAEAVDTWMVLSGIDATTFDGGLSFMFTFMHDLPTGNAFTFCIQKGPYDQPICRYFPNLDDSNRGQWLQPETPAIFVEAAGTRDMMAFFRFRDDNPAGTRRGILLDNVLIQGLTDLATETTVPTNVPPTTGPGPTQVPQPTEPPVRPGTRVFLPLAFRHAGLDLLAPKQTPLPATDTPEPSPTSEQKPLDIQMGTEIDDAGDLVNPGAVFQYGHVNLCQVTTWNDQPVGMPIRWQWYFDDRPLQGDINQQGTVRQASGKFPQCIHLTSNLPFAIGTYRVGVWIQDIADINRPPDASVSVVIQAEAPSGATQVPTPVPTLTPTPVPTPIPGTYTCQEHFTNLGFEQGPTAGWALWSNLSFGDPPKRIAVEDVILNNTFFAPNSPAYEGEWLAFFRGFATENVEQRGQHVLYASDPFPQIAPTDVLSATIEFYAMLFTEQASDGQEDDWLSPVLVWPAAGDAPPQIAVVLPEGQRVSKEVQASGAYARWRIPLASGFFDAIAMNAGAHVGFVTENTGPQATLFFLDNVSLQVCTVKRGALSAPLSATTAGVRRSYAGAPARSGLSPHLDASTTLHTDDVAQPVRVSPLVR